MVNNPPKNIDCLLMEGSTLGREDKLYKTEEEVKERLKKILLERKNIIFLFASSQNIDRIVSAYRACREADSIFVIDIYTAFILNKLKPVSEKIPQYNWKNVRVKFFLNHKKALEQAGYDDLLNTFSKRKIQMPEINKNKNRILMLARSNAIFPLILNKIKDVAGAKIAYSMWEGYLSKEFKAFCRDKGLTIEHVHTSGHAMLGDLKTFASTMNPNVLVPIHTFEPDSYPKIFKNVRVLNDGEVFDLQQSED